MCNLNDVNEEELEKLEQLQIKMNQSKDDKERKRMITEMTLIFERARVRKIQKHLRNKKG